MNDLLNQYLQWFANYHLQFILTTVVLIAYVVFRRIASPRLRAYVERDSLKSSTIGHAVLTFNVFAGIVTFVVVLFIWGFDFNGLLALSTGIVAITGVALFANWSILSNITAFFILLANPAYRQGNYIRVIEADNFIEGRIQEINIFNTLLIGASGEAIVYPNNLLVSRPTILNPSRRLYTTGKTEELRQTDQYLPE